MKYLYLFVFFVNSFLVAEDVVDVYFSSNASLSPKLVEWINGEKEAVHVAVYRLSDERISDALIRAFERGVQVEVITHQTRFSKALKALEKKGVKVSTYARKTKKSLMHHNFFIFKKNSHDQSFVWTGSSNPTKEGLSSNLENALLLEGKFLYEKFYKEFTLIPR